AKDDGTPLLWIDPATGDLTTSGAVVTGGTITGSSFLGGEIDIIDSDDNPIFHASRLRGVAIGGEERLWSLEEQIIDNASSVGNITTGWPLVEAIPGHRYRIAVEITKPAGLSNSTREVYVQWINASGTVSSESVVIPHHIPPASDGTLYDMQLTAPSGARRMRLRWRVGNYTT